MKKEYKFETISEYREYMKANSKRWYADPKNAEKKRAYQKEYYRKKKLKEAQENSNNIDNI